MSTLILKEIQSLDLKKEAANGNKYYLDCSPSLSPSGRLEILSINSDMSVIALRSNSHHSNTYHNAGDTQVYLNEPINPKVEDILNILDELIAKSKQATTRLKI